MAVRLLVEPPSRIALLSEGLEVSLKMLEMASKYSVRARRIHDARHAATALMAGTKLVYTYDVEDWQVFIPDGIVISGPVSVVSQEK